MTGPALCRAGGSYLPVESLSTATVMTFVTIFVSGPREQEQGLECASFVHLHGGFRAAGRLSSGKSAAQFFAGDSIRPPLLPEKQ